MYGVTPTDLLLIVEVVMIGVVLKFAPVKAAVALANPKIVVICASNGLMIITMSDSPPSRGFGIRQHIQTPI